MYPVAEARSVQLCRKFDRRFLIAVFALSFGSCNHSLDTKQYVEWIRDYEHGLHIKKDHKEFYFDIQYLPVDYRRITQDNYNISADSLQYFSLTIGLHNNKDLLRHDASNQTEIQQRYYYFSYLFQDNLFLQENGRRYPCRLYHFQQSITADNSKTFLLAFDASQVNSSHATLVIDSDAFDSMPLKFKILKSHPILRQL